MLDAPFGRAHTLAPRLDVRRAHCGSEGLFIGAVSLLKSECAGAGKRVFAARPLADVNRELERCYGLPIDAAAKAGGINAVAKALNDGDFARACIAAVLLRFPDMPQSSPQALMKCATALAENGLLKADPNDSKHPGYPAGTEDGKGGQFRPKTDAERAEPGVDPADVFRGILTRGAVLIARQAIQNIMVGALGATLGPEVPIAQAVKTVLDAMTAAAEAAKLLAPYVESYFDPPQTLEKLREAVRPHKRGYDVHHVIERATAAVDGSEDRVIFGEDNLVSVPTFKHWDLNRWYETKGEEYDWLTPHQYLKGKSLAERRRVGLQGLRKIGVLGP